jgi:hypothetical protein
VPAAPPVEDEELPAEPDLGPVPGALPPPDQGLPADDAADDEAEPAPPRPGAEAAEQ